MERFCTCGHDIHAHEDDEGGTHECQLCPCEQFLDVGLPFEREGYGVNEPAAWSRLYGGVCNGYYRDFGWRASFLGGGE